MFVDTNPKIHQYYKRYSGHSKAVGICWGLLTICFLIINIICFMENQWIGDSENSPGLGWMGLYEYCELFNSGNSQLCLGRFQDFGTIQIPAYRASTFFIGVSILLIFLCIFFFILFFFKEVFQYAYAICGSIQLLSTVFMFLGIVIYPSGWDHYLVTRICGTSSGRYNLGNCTFRWAYMLAIVGFFVIFMITTLAFVLSVRTNNRLKEYEKAGTEFGDMSKAGSVYGASTLNKPQSQYGQGSIYSKRQLLV